MHRFVFLAVLALIAVASAQFVYPGLTYGYGASSYAVPTGGGGYAVHGASPHYGGVTYWK